MALIMLPFLCGCEADLPQEPKVEQIPIIKASLPEMPNSRTQVAYGTKDREKGEIFLWNEGDEIFLYNLSNFQDNPTEIIYTTSKIEGKNAEFIPRNDFTNKPLHIKSGDLIVAFCGETYRKYANGPTFDSRNIFTMGVGTEANYPQIIVNDPDDSALSHMQGNLKMYALERAVENGKVPDLHFQHLSAMMRITLHNKSGHSLYPTKLEFEYPGTSSFFNTTMYLSVVKESDEEIEVESKNGSTTWSDCPSVLSGYNLRVYGGYDFYTSSEGNQYTDKIGTTINAKDNTTDTGETIPNDSIYELYLSTVPRLGNDRKGDKLIIDFIVKHDTDHPYSITIENFDVPIEAGKRYWFDLTATPDTTLMLTSEWKALQESKNNGGAGTE